MKCKFCKCKVNKEDLIVRWINYFCSNSCYSDFMDNIPKKVIKSISKKNKNTPAKFSKEVKAQILLRDKHCIFCDNWITDIHHVYFWTESNRTETRNDVNQWVWVCRVCHNEIHWCAIWKGKRQEAIEYLKQFN